MNDIDLFYDEFRRYIFGTLIKNSDKKEECLKAAKLYKDFRNWLYRKLEEKYSLIHWNSIKEIVDTEDMINYYCEWLMEDEDSSS